MLLLLASLSVIIPCEVDIMAIPSPFKILGISSLFTYLLKPGLLTL